MAANGETCQFPPVELDFTLADVLKVGATGDDTDVETVCMLKPNSDHQYGTAVPLSDKYIIHSAQVDDGDDLAHLQLENCCHLLLFFNGPTNVIFVACEGETNDETLDKEHIQRNATRSFGVIKEDQRPRVITYKNIEDCVRNHDGSKIRWGFAMDFADRLPHLFHPELVYKLNSKRWLAVVPQPRSAHDHLIECEIKCPKHQVKTRDHKEMWYYGGADCHECAAGIEAEIARITNILQKRTIPYVLKLTQSLSSVGTNIVTSEDDQKEVIEKMADCLSNYLPRITKENAYLYTTTLILSDHIPGKTMALNFFVRRDGSLVYSGACHQLATGEGGRQATAITYADQEKLEKKYRKTLEAICKTLHEEGYYGAVGADIMEDESGAQFTIDLNVRTPLSLVLYLLKGHFNEKRGFGMSLVYECVQLTISREELEKRFNKEFGEARIVLLGSARFGEKKQWAYGMIIAGEGKKEIDELSDRILKFEA